MTALWGKILKVENMTIIWSIFFFFFQYIYPFTHIKCGTKAPILFMQVKSFIYADENASYWLAN